MTKRTTFEGMAEWLTARDDFALLGHLSPDGDAAGTTLGLWHLLRALGKRAVVCLPGGVPELYADLPGAETVIPTGEPLPFEPQTALAVDVSDPERLGEAGVALFNRCPHRGVIDHHGTNPGFGDIMLLDGEAAAAGELMVNVAEAMGVPLSLEAAECLFVAISTDTGHFSYSNTRPETLRAAERCLIGIDVNRITERLYRTRTLSRTRLLALVLGDLEVSPDGRIAWARLTRAMLDEAKATYEDNEGIINYLREIEGVQIAVLAQEHENSVTKLSFRSGPPVDVAKGIATPLGGGGHACAAGATVNASVDEALKIALELARKTLNP